MFLDVDVPLCRDFAMHEEKKYDWLMDRAQLVYFFIYTCGLAFSFERANIIVDTLRGQDYG